MDSAIRVPADELAAAISKPDRSMTILKAYQPLEREKKEGVNAWRAAKFVGLSLAFAGLFGAVLGVTWLFAWLMEAGRYEVIAVAVCLIFGTFMAWICTEMKRLAEDRAKLWISACRAFDPNHPKERESDGRPSASDDATHGARRPSCRRGKTHGDSAVVARREPNP